MGAWKFIKLQHLLASLLVCGSLVGGCKDDSSAPELPREKVKKPAPNDDCSRLGLADAPITYEGAVSQIISGNCTMAGCHEAKGVAPDLTTYAKAKAAAAAALVAIEQNQMPKNFILDSATKIKFKAWVDGGLLERGPSPSPSPSPSLSASPSPSPSANASPSPKNSPSPSPVGTQTRTPTPSATPKPKVPADDPCLFLDHNADDELH